MIKLNSNIVISKAKEWDKIPLNTTAQRLAFAYDILNLTGVEFNFNCPGIDFVKNNDNNNKKKRISKYNPMQSSSKSEK